MSDELKVLLRTLEGELYIKERELENVINIKNYDYNKFKNILKECSELNQIILLFQRYFKTDENN